MGTGLADRRRAAQNKQRALEMREKGLSVRLIATELRLSTQRIYQYLNEQDQEAS